MQPTVIKLLSPELIGKIAAGEVVERPAAAIKELVENSVDAGATAVTVEIQDGGITSFRVSDNGCGIRQDQLKMAFERHATSKLHEEKELFAIPTLGFRGEALASIAAVAKVKCTTRTAEDDFGACIAVEAGSITDFRQAASPIGTAVVVKELFFNTPVRLKFLKKPTVEAALISDYLMRLILSRPDISFRFVNQGKTIYHSPGDGKLSTAIYCVYGRETLRELFAVEGSRYGVLLSGYVGVGEQTRGNRMQQSFFINGRYFRSEELGRALDVACRGQVMIGRYPLAVLSLQMPFDRVDVNVHPNKLEVRFQDEKHVAACVEELVFEALNARTAKDALLGGESKAPEAEPNKSNVVVESLAGGTEEEQAEALVNARLSLMPDSLADAPADRPEPIRERAPAVSSERAREILRSYGERGASFVESYQPAARTFSASASPPPAVKSQLQEEQQTFAAPASASDTLRYIGSAFHTYLLFESGERLLLIDQHAAHERLLFDKLMKAHEADRQAQQLLSPQLLRVTAREMAFLLDAQEALADAGFRYEAFDETSVAIHAAPMLFGSAPPAAELLREALDQMMTQPGKPNCERIRAMVAQMACKRAVKAGDALTEQDARTLLADMLTSGVPPTCPHGRPIVVEMTQKELEKRFKRIQ